MHVLLLSRTDTVNLLKSLVARIGALTPFLNFKNRPALGPSLSAYSAFVRAHFAKKIPSVSEPVVARVCAWFFI